MYPAYKSEKTRLQWADCKWSEGHVEIPATTAKVGRRRIVPIPDAVTAWLAHHCPDYRERKGDACPGQPPDNIRPRHTTELGKLVGGWRRNALRHSAISYNCAKHGAGKTAMWAGNSESKVKSNYLDAKTEADADEFFNLRPESE